MEAKFICITATVNSRTQEYPQMICSTKDKEVPEKVKLQTVERMVLEIELHSSGDTTSISTEKIVFDILKKLKAVGLKK